MQNSTQPLVSVIMALYNGAKFLDYAINSVVNQTYPFWELIIIDDGSTDDSIVVAKLWEYRNRKIKVLQHEGGCNRGVSATRNLGISVSTGQIIALLDCDDVWLDHKLEKQIDVFTNNTEIGLIYSKAEVIDDQGKPIKNNFEKIAQAGRPPIFGSGISGKKTFRLNDYLSSGCWLPASSVIFTRSIGEEVGFFNENLPYQVEDSLLFMEISERSGLYFMEEILVLYRIHSSQWNAKLDMAKKLDSSLTLYLFLIKSVKKESRSLVSKKIIDYSFQRVVNQFISFGNPRLRIVFLSYYKIISSSEISIWFKLKGMFIILVRIISIPIKIKI